MTNKDGGTAMEPAFPNYIPNRDGSLWVANGMDLRDYLAAFALQSCPVNAHEHDNVAKWAYALADAMLAARATPQPDPVREELVEALEKARAHLAGDEASGWNETMKVINVALSKAKGGQS